MTAAFDKNELRRFARDYAETIRGGAPLASDMAARRHGDQSAVAQVAARWKVRAHTATRRLRLAANAGFAPLWRAEEERRGKTDAARDPLPATASPRPGRRVVLLTAAQDETPLDDGFWRNLLAYKALRKADLLIGGFTYQKGLFEDHSVRAGVYVADLVPFLQPAEIRLAPHLLWCGQANILPTAGNPLTGWQTHGGHTSIVVPHAKIAMESVAVMTPPAKIAVSTGVVTRPNYIRRNAGMKAEWHHTLGFVIAEIADDGMHWLRTVSAEKDGSFQDLDLRVAGGRVRAGCRVEAITWGDIHHERLDPAMSRLGWGVTPAGMADPPDGPAMVDALRPRFQFFHDLIDFSARNHHRRADPDHMTAMFARRSDSVAAEIAAAAQWLRSAARPFARTVVVDSNHNDALLRWLRAPDARTDPANAAIWHEWNGAWHRAIIAADEAFHPFAHALKTSGAPAFEFVRAGDSFLVCETSAAVECGLHGHHGPNGARGSVAAFARVAPRVNVGHGHAPAIREAAYMAGVNGALRMDYNFGPSAWAHADIVTHGSGKRQIVVKSQKGWRGQW